MQQFGPSFYALERLWPKVAHDWAEYTKSKACCTICRDLVGEGVKCRGCNYHVHRKCLSGTQDYCTQERIGFDLAQALMYAMADRRAGGSRHMLCSWVEDRPGYVGCANWYLRQLTLCSFGLAYRMQWQATLP
jgi:hypothetical protein